MNNRFNLSVQMEALHTALIERFPETARYLCVGGFNGQWVEFIYSDPHPEMEALVDLVPALQLYPDKALIAAGGQEISTVQVKVSDSSLTSISISVYIDSSNRTEIPVDLVDGIGEIEITSVLPGVVTVERMDGQYFARAYMEVM